MYLKPKGISFLFFRETLYLSYRLVIWPFSLICLNCVQSGKVSVTDLAAGLYIMCISQQKALGTFILEVIVDLDNVKIALIL